MGCFLACFGFSSKKKKRRRPPKTLFIGDKSHGSYQPLDAHVPVDLDLTENENSAPGSCNPPTSNKQLIVKTIKKVRFDLNVRAYEPISPADTSPRCSLSDEEGTKAKGPGEIEEIKTLTGGTGSAGSVGGGAQGQPLNYRYQNCIDSYDEDDELVYLDCDSEDEIESDDESDNFDDLSDDLQDLEEEAPLRNLMDNSTQELKACSSDENAWNKGKYVHSVLTPVENIVQWKTMKAKAAPQSRCNLKENVGMERETRLPLELNSKFSKPRVGADDMVNSSLSSWLTLPRTDSHSLDANSTLLRTI